MFQPFPKSKNIDDNFKLLFQAQSGLLAAEKNQLATLANMSALLNYFLDDINWVGFYLLDTENPDTLLLGPFQGLPACTRIALGKGVCGTAAAQNQTLNIADVHQFPGHIACDANSRSELVIPLVKNHQVIGVLDIDAPITERFSAIEQKYIEEFVARLMTQLAAENEVTA